VLCQRQADDVLTAYQGAANHNNKKVGHPVGGRVRDKKRNGVKCFPRDNFCGVVLRLLSSLTEKRPKNARKICRYRAEGNPGFSIPTSPICFVGGPAGRESVR
jgi:hypothetical protein